MYITLIKAQGQIRGWQKSDNESQRNKREM